MPSLQKVIDAIDMIDKQHLDIRTITMGISLLDCASEDVGRCCEKIYDKICHKAENLVRTGESIEREFGIPIVNKRISVTPMALVARKLSDRGLCALCPHDGQGCKNVRRRLHRRLFRAGAEGLHLGR